MEKLTHKEITFSDSAKFIIKELCVDRMSFDQASQELLFLVSQIDSEENRNKFIADLELYIKKIMDDTEKACIIIDSLKDVLSQNAKPEVPVKNFEVPGKDGLNRRALKILHNPAMR